MFTWSWRPQLGQNERPAETGFPQLPQKDVATTSAENYLHARISQFRFSAIATTIENRPRRLERHAVEP